MQVDTSRTQEDIGPVPARLRATARSPARYSSSCSSMARMSLACGVRFSNSSTDARSAGSSSRT